MLWKLGNEARWKNGAKTKIVCEEKTGTKVANPKSVLVSSPDEDGFRDFLFL
jgi:hypothetical protein